LRQKTVLIDFPAQIISLSAVNFATKTTSQHSHVMYQTKAKGVLDHVCGSSVVGGIDIGG
jgi:hypothetical protein